VKNALIIDRPDLQAWQQKAIFGALTAAFWVIWVVLWLPLVTLLGWLFFGYQFQFHMIRLDGYQGFLNTLAIYAMVIMAMGGALIVWAKYNHLRFRGMDRRKEVVAPTTEQLAVLHRRSVTTIEQWQSFFVMTVHHDEHGAIKRVVPDPTAGPAEDLRSGLDQSLQGEPVVQVS
jgi:biofilm PGA synthesis protein PgaD